MRCSMTAALCAYFLSPVSRYASPRFSSPSTRCLCHIQDRKSTRLNSSHSQISYAVFCLKKKIGTVAETIDEVLAAGGSLAAPIAPIATDTFWHTFVGVDNARRTLTPLITWRSTRTRQAA